MRLLAFAFICAVFAQPILALAGSIEDCDRLTASQYDPDRRADPVPQYSIPFDEAIKACERGSREAENEGRIWFQLGLAYERKAFEFDDQALYRLAEAMYQRAIRLNHPAAFNALGSLYESGEADFSSVAKAFDTFQLGHAKGDSGSSSSLAIYYADFVYAAQDCGKAWELVQAARAKPTGHVYSLLGVLHRDGMCGDELPEIKRDLRLAETYFRKAVELGHRSAMRNLAALLEKSKAPAVPDEALRLYLRSAELGDGLAARNVGRLYQWGRGVPRDDAKAVEWFRRGAKLKDTRAMRDLSFMLRTGRLGVKAAAPQTKEADMWAKRARDVARRRADLGSRFEMHQLAEMLSEGEGGPSDRTAALRYAEQAADRGVLEALSFAGFLHDKAGQHKLALSYYEKGTKLGHAQAKANLGNAYCFGRGVDKDCVKGKALLVEASVESGWAAQRLAEIFYNEKQYSDARKYYDAAVLLNNADAMVRLALLILENTGKVTNPNSQHFSDGRAKAIDLIDGAASLGSLSAYRMLADLELVLLDQQKRRDYCAKLVPLVFVRYEQSAKLGDMQAHDRLMDLVDAVSCPVVANAKYGVSREAASAGAANGPDRLAYYCFTERAAACNRPEVLALLTASAENGQFRAMLVLGGLLEQGEHTEKNQSEADRLFAVIESSGTADARLALASDWISGKGRIAVRKNRGMDLLRVLAAEKHPQSMRVLGHLLLEAGTEVTQREAITILEEVAALGGPWTRVRSDIFFWLAENLSKLGPSDQQFFREWATKDTADVDRLGRWGTTLLEHGNTASLKSEGLNLLISIAEKFSISHVMVEVGLAFQEGRGSEKDIKRAQEYFDKAAALDEDTGVVMASYFCFLVKADGRHCRFKPQEYAQMLKLSVQNGHRHPAVYEIFGRWLLNPTLSTNRTELAQLITMLATDATVEQLAEMGLGPKAKSDGQPTAEMVRALQRQLKLARLYAGSEDGRLSSLNQGMRPQRAQ